MLDLMQDAANAVFRCWYSIKAENPNGLSETKLGRIGD
jgi:hypothetical protein